MKLCEDHWSELRRLIDERGLTHLVSPDGAEAARRLAEDGFDPLMGAHNALVFNLVEVVGPVVLTLDGCPLCYAIEQCPCGRGPECHFIGWPGHAADGALEAARERGLVETQ